MGTLAFDSKGLDEPAERRTSHPQLTSAIGLKALIHGAFAKKGLEQLTMPRKQLGRIICHAVDPREHRFADRAVSDEMSKKFTKLRRPCSREIHLCQTVSGLSVLLPVARYGHRS